MPDYGSGSADILKEVNGMKLAAIYARVSTKRQEQEGTIESQIAALLEYALQHDYRLIFRSFLTTVHEFYVGRRPVQIDHQRYCQRASSMQGICHVRRCQPSIQISRQRHQVEDSLLQV